MDGYQILTGVIGLAFVLFALYEAWDYYRGNKEAIGPVWLRILARIVLPLVIAAFLVVIAIAPETSEQVSDLVGMWEISEREGFQRRALTVAWVGVWLLFLAVLYLLYQVMVIRRELME